MTRAVVRGYPVDWPEISQRVKAAAGWSCIRCGHPHDVASSHVLTVHHLDMDKANCRWWNLLALCQRCHLSVQARVVLERQYMFGHSSWFAPYVAGYYARACLGVDEMPREQVEARLDELLALGRVA